MPTSSSQPRPDTDLHQHRQVAESFGTDAERYDRARPRYPSVLVERILAGGTGSNVLDVGCGTGIVARQFQAAGCTVLGIEPDVRMAEWAEQHGLTVEVSSFEAWDPAGRVFDAIVSGQTWHWIDATAGAAKAQQALRPGGRLAVFWNADRAPRELADAFAAVYREVAPDSLAARLWETDVLAGYEGLGAKAAAAIRRTGAFGEPEHWRFEWEQVYTRDQWLDQLPTQGDHSQFPIAKLARLTTGIGAAIDAVGGSFTMHYTTTTVAAVRGD